MVFIETQVYHKNIWSIFDYYYKLETMNSSVIFRQTLNHIIKDFHKYETQHIVQQKYI